MSSRYPALPLPLTTLVGREREIAVVGDLLRRPEVRLVTLTGPGGIGKTRLAIAVAEELAEAFPDGIAFVPLAAVRDPDLVPAAIAHALDVRDTGQRSVTDSIASVIGDEQMLLILDNFEQVLNAASVVSALLVACPRLSVGFVTSRAVLRLSGEHNVPVQPLGLTRPDRLPAFERLSEIESIQLFVQRAREARADFVLTEANAPAVAAICVRVDGLPLAIELAAARVRLLSPQALLAKLEQRLQLLAGGPRDQPARLQTMHGAIAWSYDLLDPDEQRLFVQLAAFSGGWTLEAAEAICGDDHDVLTGLDILVDHSLVRQIEEPDGSTRFTMLEMVREFGLEELQASGTEASVRQRHAAYFLALAEEAGPRLEGLDQAYWLDRLAVDHANLSAALRWLNQQEDAAHALRMVAALGQYWFVRGQLGEALALVDATLVLPGASEPSVARAAGLKTASWITLWAGEIHRAEALAEEGLAILRAAGESKDIPYFLDCLGLALGFQGDMDRACAAWEACIPLAREQGDMTNLSVALGNLGAVAVMAGDDRKGLRLFSESLAIAREAQEPEPISLMLEWLGKIESRLGDVAVAKQYFHEALTINWRRGAQWGIARMLESIADVIVGVERAESAIRLFGAAGTLRNRAGIPQWAHEQPAFERRLAEFRTLLGSEGFDAAWWEGTVLPLADAVREAFTYVAPPEPALQPSGAKDPTPSHGLTPRELDVLRLIVEGLSDREIAERLFISPHTVMRHVAGIFNKLAVNSRTAAATWAMRHDIN